MTIFITGSESFVGRELIRQFRAAGVRIVGIDKTSTPSQDYEFYNADLCSSDILKLIPEGADAIVHLGGLSRDADCKDRLYECFDVNVMGTLNMVDAALERKVKQFIFASSEWVYGPFAKGEIKDEDSPIDITQISSEYALSKLVSEMNLRQIHGQTNLSITVLRFAIIYGPRPGNWAAVESLFHTVATKDVIEVGSLQTGRCFVHVADIASGIRAAIGATGFEIINLAGDTLVTLGDVIELSKKVLNKNPKIIETNPGMPSVRHIANKKAKTTLHWQPAIDSITGIKTLSSIL